MATTITHRRFYRWLRASASRTVIAIVVTVSVAAGLVGGGIAVTSSHSDGKVVLHGEALSCSGALAPWVYYATQNPEAGTLATAGVQESVSQIPVIATEVYFKEYPANAGIIKATTDEFNTLTNECEHFAQRNPNFDFSTIPTPPSA
jgi:hypothetical protein